MASSFAQMEVTCESFSLEEAIFAMLDPETVEQAETILEASFLNPNSLALICPLLISLIPGSGITHSPFFHESLHIIKRHHRLSHLSSPNSSGELSHSAEIPNISHRLGSSFPQFFA
jgi:hypothetical protein